MTGSGSTRTANGPVAVGANPFSRRAVLALVVIGSALLVALLYMIGTGTGMGSANNGQAHAASKGVTGFAAMADYLERRGYAVRLSRNEAALTDSDLLVLTPPAMADGEEIDRIVSAHRYEGATLIVLPKWVSIPPAREQRGDAESGWVRIAGTQGAHWPGFLDDVMATVGPIDANGQRARWLGPAQLSGELPDRESLSWGAGENLFPLVREHDGRILAALYADGGNYPDLWELMGAQPDEDYEPDDSRIYPVILVFEPDLLNNWGMAERENAQLLDRLIPALEVGRGGSITFDLTLNGLGRPKNLLTLAFTPPFLAATLCLLLAALAVGWRGFLRFGPPLASERAIAFGKRALVANTAGFIRRTRRFHLLGGPYAERSREKLARALGLPRTLAAADSEAAIDRALAASHPDIEPFSLVAARLRAARRPHELIKAARDLHALERMLIR